MDIIFINILYSNDLLSYIAKLYTLPWNDSSFHLKFAYLT